MRMLFQIQLVLLSTALCLETYPYYKAEQLAQRLNHLTGLEAADSSETEEGEQMVRADSDTLRDNLRVRSSEMEVWLADLPDHYEDHVHNLNGLKEVNPDIQGWLWIPELTIDEPVCQAADSDTWYLDHLADGSENKLGALFLSAENALSDQHLIIFGHNMRSGQKFGVLKQYEDRRAQENCQLAIFYLPEIIRVYRIYSSYCTDACDMVAYQRIPDSERARGQICDLYAATKRKNQFIAPENRIQSIPEPDLRTDWISDILTLSTCEGNGRSRRVVHYLQILTLPSCRENP